MLKKYKLPQLRPCWRCAAHPVVDGDIVATFCRHRHGGALFFRSNQRWLVVTDVGGQDGLARFLETTRAALGLVLFALPVDGEAPAGVIDLEAARRRLAEANRGE